LKEALSSKEAFQRHYLELSELAMGTYKHIGRVRSARMIARDLADFYMKLDDYQKAESFLMDCLKTYKQEGWDFLADHTRLKMAQCQKVMGIRHKYVRSCMHVGASKILDVPTKVHYQNEMMELAKEIEGDPLCVKSKPVIYVTGLTPSIPCFVLSEEIKVELIIHSDLPEPITADTISLSQVQCSKIQSSGLVDETTKVSRSPKKKTRYRNPSESSTNDIEKIGQGRTRAIPVPQELDVQPHLEVAGNQVVTSTSVVCKTVFKRTDSGGQLMRDKEMIKDDYTLALQACDVQLLPGTNRVLLKGKLKEVDTYQPSQLCVSFGGLHLLKSLTEAEVDWQVVPDFPIATLNVMEEPMMSGIPQELAFKVNSGGVCLPEASVVRVDLPSDISVHEDSTQEGNIVLPAMESHHQHQVTLMVVAELPEGKLDDVEHEINFFCDWQEPTNIMISFKHPLKITQNLLTAHQRKYIQIFVESVSDREFVLMEPCLKSNSPDVDFLLLNSKQALTVDAQRSVSYVWEMKCNIPDAVPLDCVYTMLYQLQTPSQDIARQCSYQFPLNMYQTLCEVSSDIQPLEDDEKCCVGTGCQLHVKVDSLHPNTSDSVTLMYEVGAEAAYWSISGKTAGVFSLENGHYETMLEIMPLSPGYIPVPKIKLSKYLKTNSDDEDSCPVPSVGVKLEPFSSGQVYNRTAAIQVQVVPKPNTSHVEIVAGM